MSYERSGNAGEDVISSTASGLLREIVIMMIMIMIILYVQCTYDLFDSFGSSDHFLHDHHPFIRISLASYYPLRFAGQCRSSFSLVSSPFPYVTVLSPISPLHLHCLSGTAYLLQHRCNALRLEMPGWMRAMNNKRNDVPLAKYRDFH